MHQFYFILLGVSVILATVINTVLCCEKITATTSTKYIKSHSGYGSSKYKPYTRKCWEIRTQTTSRSKIIRLYRNGFDLEDYRSSQCINDRLTVYDSEAASGKSVNFCGRNIFQVLYSSGNHMYISFRTNSAKEFRGFKLGVKQVASNLYSSTRWSSSYYKYGTTLTSPEKTNDNDGSSVNSKNSNNTANFNDSGSGIGHSGTLTTTHYAFIGFGVVFAVIFFTITGCMFYRMKRQRSNFL